MTWKIIGIMKMTRKNSSLRMNRPHVTKNSWQITNIPKWPDPNIIRETSTGLLVNFTYAEWADILEFLSHEADEILVQLKEKEYDQEIKFKNRHSLIALQDLLMECLG